MTTTDNDTQDYAITPLGGPTSGAKIALRELMEATIEAKLKAAGAIAPDARVVVSFASDD